jgi:hypothetical protein
MPSQIFANLAGMLTSSPANLPSSKAIIDFSPA